MTPGTQDIVSIANLAKIQTYSWQLENRLKNQNFTFMLKIF